MTGIFKKLLTTTLGLSFSLSFPLTAQQSDYPIRPVDFTQVHVNSGFWKARLDSVQKVTIPYAFNKCEETGRIDNFIFAAGIEQGRFKGSYGFDDSDVYKIIEGASYSLMNEPDSQLRSYVGKLVGYIAAAQEDDGYLYTPWTLKANDYTKMACCSYDPAGKFVGTRSSHEFYNAGHMYEAAVAHYEATGERTFLDVAIKNADLIYHVCVEEGKPYYSGHQEIEIGLVKLYRVTGDKRYLNLAKLFLDRRGTGLRTYQNTGPHLYTYDLYAQDHEPVTEQDEAVGHAVRAGYMYSAMADVAAITGDQDYLHAIDKIWQDVVGRKLYITGGLGAGNGIEGFDKDYVLPNDAYAETCAAIANVYWNHRMFLLHGESKYIDVMERTLYNGLIAGLSLEGDKFFYPNPLVYDGKGSFNQGAVCRSPWFDCSCCPSNLCRFVPSVSGYAYAVTDNDLFVNLYMDSHAEMKVGDKQLIIDQSTEYPWDGRVVLQFENRQEIPARIHIRIPGWSTNDPVPTDLYRFKNNKATPTAVRVNGKVAKYEMQQGYAVITGSWKRGDKVEVTIPMEVRAMTANPKVEADAGLVALQRGPILYCAEGVDNSEPISDIHPDVDAKFTAGFKPDLLNGVVMLKGKGVAGTGGAAHKVDLNLIPYYAWGHRSQADMAVWLSE